MKECSIGTENGSIRAWIDVSFLETLDKYCRPNVAPQSAPVTQSESGSLEDTPGSKRGQGCG